MEQFCYNQTGGVPPELGGKLTALDIKMLK